VIAASLGTLTAYFAATKSDVVQQRNDVRSDVSTLTTQQSTLKDQVTRLKSQNADLRQQLDAASASSGSAGDAPSDPPSGVVTRTLRVPLPESSSICGVVGQRHRRPKRDLRRLLLRAAGFHRPPAA
jgi:chromosome segregation ATPase